ncbi:MAG: hypothetical protein HY329_23710, partial [Chloroflexi bacterium]|nr:hypothetical protein [Chloroflexota bacterium]
MKSCTRRSAGIVPLRPGSNQPEDAWGERDPVLLAKLQPPPLLGPQIPRSRVEALLDDLGERSVVVIVAPLGYGKTSFLTTYFARRDLPVAWCTLDATDADPVRLLAHLSAATAVLPSEPGRTLVGRVRAELTLRDQHRLLDRMLTELQYAASGEGGCILLVLDDLHTVNTVDGGSGRLLDYLVGHALPGVRVVLVSRAEPTLPSLARLRAQGRVLDLRLGDLRFSDDEARALLEAGFPPRSHDGALSELIREAEGWPIVLQFARVGGADAGKRRDVLFEYLAAELLDTVPPDVCEFALRCSVLLELNAELCAEVTGQADASRLLRQIAASWLPLQAVGAERYRLHALVAEFLYAQLPARLGEAERQRCHRRAVSAFCRLGRCGDALAQLAAADRERFIELLAGLPAQRLLRDDDRLRLLDCLSRVALGLPPNRPNLLTHLGWPASGGEIESAGRAAVGSRALAIQPNLTPPGDLVYAGAVFDAIRRGDTARAAAVLNAWHRLPLEPVTAVVRAHADLVLSWIVAPLAVTGTKLQRFGECIDQLPPPTRESWKPLLGSFEALHELSCGRVSRARAVIEKLPGEAAAAGVIQSFHRDLAVARVRLAEGNASAAVALVNERDLPPTTAHSLPELELKLAEVYWGAERYDVADRFYARVAARAERTGDRAATGVALAGRAAMSALLRRRIGGEIRRELLDTTATPLWHQAWEAGYRGAALKIAAALNEPADKARAALELAVELQSERGDTYRLVGALVHLADLDLRVDDRGAARR